MNYKVLLATFGLCFVSIFGQTGCQNKNPDSAPDTWTGPVPFVKKGDKLVSMVAGSGESSSDTDAIQMLDERSQQPVPYAKVKVESACGLGADKSVSNSIEFQGMKAIGIQNALPEELYATAFDHDRVSVRCTLTVTVFNALGSTRTSVMEFDNLLLSHPRPLALKIDYDDLTSDIAKNKIFETTDHIGLVGQPSAKAVVRVLCSDFKTDYQKVTIETFNLNDIARSSIKGVASDDDPRDRNPIQTCRILLRDPSNWLFMSEPLRLNFGGPKLDVTFSRLDVPGANPNPGGLGLWKVQVINRNAFPVMIAFPEDTQGAWVGVHRNNTTPDLMVNNYGNHIRYQLSSRQQRLSYGAMSFATVAPFNTLEIVAQAQFSNANWMESFPQFPGPQGLEAGLYSRFMQTCIFTKQMGYLLLPGYKFTIQQAATPLAEGDLKSFQMVRDYDQIVSPANDVVYCH